MSYQLHSATTCEAPSNKGAASPPPAGYGCDDGTPHPSFTTAQAQRLAQDLFTKAQLAVGTDVEHYLVRLLRALPCAEGDVLDVVDIHQEAFLRELEKDAKGSPPVPGADQVGLLLTLALARRAGPALKEWVDVTAFAEERKRINGSDGSQTDAEKEYGRFLNKVMQAGLLRQAPPQMEPARLLELQAAFPNFGAPIRFLAQQAAYAHLCGLPFQPPAMLFTGPAGVGKTSFAAALAQVLNSHHEVVNMASQSCGFTLAGMDRGWSTARPGMVFTALMYGATLSPVILLDEIDKTSEDGRSSPTGPLYALLEPRTARGFRDEYAGFPIDARGVVWLATANDTSTMAPPLLSRFKVFDIPMPTHAEMIGIARTMLRELSRPLPQGPLDLPEAWEAQMAGCSVRDLRLRLQEALGQAALRAFGGPGGHLALEERDWACAQVGRRQAIGFF